MPKRTFDLVLSAIGLALLAPLLFLVAVLVKLDSPGPVFYRGVRTGRYGRPFRIFKFRSMVVGADRLGTAVTGTHDPRLIRRIQDWALTNQVAMNGFCEFQMLYGIQRAEQIRLAQGGWKSVVLVAYGSYWFPWYMRRLAERPANVWFVARSLVAR